MTKQIAFILYFLAAMGVFSFTSWRIITFFRITKKGFPVDRIAERLWITLLVAFGQTKILRKPVSGFLHALVWWGFLLILFGTVEMIFDGIFATERCLAQLGGVYDILVASGDVFAAMIIISCVVFLYRRYILKIHRFKGVEMKSKSKIDAAIALSLILILMISLIGMNAGYMLLNPGSYSGCFPVAGIFLPVLSGLQPGGMHALYETCWWLHIGMVFIFLNILPYSKHFHVIMSVPNVFLSRLGPMTQAGNMPSVTKEIMTLMEPVAAATAADSANIPPPSRFGVKDAEDISWKNLADALTCTECGRCTSVCPANTTGKLLSPRKIMIDTRKRMYEKGLRLSADHSYNDGKSLVGDYISKEELLACTTCNACVQECPVNIDHVSLILDMRRYLIMEEANPPASWTSMFNNIENNGAPWQFSSSDRLNWAAESEVKVSTMAELAASGESPEILFWVGCSGSFDDRYKKVTLALVKILSAAGIKFAVLGTEESCTGDPAKRAGNEFLFQMQALKNIQTLNRYKIKKIVTGCPHCFNTLKNEYDGLGGKYDVIHHSTLLKQLIDEKRIILNGNDIFKENRVTFHDPCYLGRGNGIYEAPREVLDELFKDVKEMERNKSRGFCCGAGGGQMFKEAEKGNHEVNVNRTEEALALKPNIIATACPFCMTMMTDGVKHFNKEEEVKVFDLAELVSKKNVL